MGQAVKTEAAATGPAVKTLSLERSQTRLAWLMLLPTLAVVAFVALYPLIQTVYLSFTNARLASGREPVFVGFNNYVRLFTQDQQWWGSIVVTVEFTILTIIFEFVLGMIIALTINSNFKGRGLMRAAMLIPWAIPTVISAQMWKWMFQDNFGVINDFLRFKVHLISTNVAWLSQSNTSIFAVAMIDIWKTTPFVALLLLAGLQVIPGEVYEAATVDGANPVQQFFRITLPLLRPAILVTLIFRTLDALRVFDVFYVVFGARPDTQTMAIYNQQTLVAFSRLGYGSAISMGIFLVIALFVVAYMTAFRPENI
jgi:trehalose/maltose transport system permease protein